MISLLKRFLLISLAIATSANALDTLRPEISKPLLAAQNYLKAQRPRDALAKVAEADAISNKSDYESLTIWRMQAAAAQQAGDNTTAVRAYTRLLDSGRLDEPQRMQTVAALASTEYQLQHYAQASQWAARYLKERAGDPQMATLLMQSSYLVGDCRGVSGALPSGKPPEASLQLLANCYQKQGDDAGYVAALERVVAIYPTTSNWSVLLRQVGRKPGFARSHLELDVYRLRLAVGDISSADDYMQMTQLSLANGYPSEALRVVEKGFSVGVLGAGAQAGREHRLRDLARARQREAVAQSDGASGADSHWKATFDALLGGARKNPAAIEADARKVQGSRPDESRLHLGIAYYLAGDKGKAIQTFKTVSGNDGSSDLARLWLVKMQGD